MSEHNKIFIIDDKSAVCDAAKKIIAGAKYNVSCVTSCADALSAVHREHYDVIILHIKHRSKDEVKCIEAIHALKSHVPILVITDDGDLPLAVDMLKRGATHYFDKPFDEAKLLSAVKELNDEFFERHKHWHQTLSTVEISIIELLMAGKCNKEIAQMQCRSPRTIEHHRERIIKKIGDKLPYYLNVWQQSFAKECYSILP